jgi:ATP-binding cassette, subfamily B, bacterial
MNAEIHTSAATWRERLRALHNIRPLIGIVWKAGPAVVTGGLVGRVLAALAPLAILSVTRLILNAIQAHTQGRPLPSYFWYLVLAEFCLAALAAMLSRVVAFFDSLLADRFTRYVSVRVMTHASRLDLATYEDPAFYDKLERARVQATDRIYMIQAMGQLLQQFVTAASLSAAVAVFSPWLLLLLIAAVVPAFLGESHYAFLGFTQNIRQTPIKRQLDYLRQVGASKESAKELKLFGLSDFLSAEYDRLATQIYEQNISLARRRLLAGAGLAVISTAGYYGAFAYVVFRTVAGALTWGDLQYLAGSILGASQNIQQIFATFASIADQSLFLTDMVDFFNVTPKLASRPDGIPAPRPIRDGFLFDRVSFTYPGTERLVLDNLNLRIAAGERIALIGENGEGKTTLVKLVTRLYDPTSGRILLDGVDLREYRLDDLQSQIGVIFQDFMRYEMTAWQNIAVGRLDVLRKDVPPNGEVPEAASKSLADAVIERLPQSYDQLLGRRFEGGVDLSGGEWQKIALARAYLRDAQVLILDEPTASLDARSEYDVFQRFADLTAGKTALLISHRFSTVRMADRIVVLENGRIAEEGSHNQLIALRGRYADMFELQASSYR